VTGSHALTKSVDCSELLSELIAGGVTMSININDKEITLFGDVDSATLTSQLSIVASVEAAHTPTTITKVTLQASPHLRTFISDCLTSSAGITHIAIELPDSYPGDAILRHNSLSSSDQTSLSNAATDHDPSAVPFLSVDVASQVIAADGSASGTVVVTDSRGAGAAGNTVKLRIPSGGSAGVDADTYTLDASGQATANFQATTTLTGELTFEFYYADGSADPATFKVRRGT